MPSLIIAFSLAIGAIIASVFLLTTVGVPKEIAGPVSTAIMGSVPFLRDTLDSRHKLAEADTRQDMIGSIEAHGLPMTRLILYGWLFMLASLELSSVVGGLMAMATKIEKEIYVETVLLVTFLTAWPAIFLTGRWIGRKYISHGVITVIVIASIIPFSASIIDIIFVPKTVFKALFHIEKPIEIIKLYVSYGIAITILISILGLIGFWRGRHQRLTAYLEYLMKQVSPDTRNVIVELAYEEAKKSSDTRGDQKPNISDIAG